MAEIGNLTLKVTMEIKESIDDFIFTTIAPYCETITSQKLSKKDLEKILLFAQRKIWYTIDEKLPEPFDLVLFKTKIKTYEIGAYDKTNRQFYLISLTERKTWDVNAVEKWAYIRELEAEL